MRLLYISMQKSGTHIIWQLLGQGFLVKDEINTFQGSHPDRRIAQILRELGDKSHAHMPYCSDYEAILREHEDLKVIFSYRDPRDVVLSYIHWMARGAYGGDEWIHLPDDILAHKLREDWLNGKARRFFASFEGWLNVPWIYKVRYEDLRLDLQKAVEKMHAFLDMPELGSVDNYIRRLRSDSHTYRKALVGEWKDRFTGELKDELYAEIEPFITRYGYEL